MTPFNDLDRRTFLANIGRTTALAAVSSASLSAMLTELQAMSRQGDMLAPDEAARDEEFWFPVQQSFSVSRHFINLNNGGVSPSPRIVTEALVRYQWQQEDATAYTMWQVMQPQVETIRTGLAELFGCDREEMAVTRNASESLETVLMGLDLKSGDEVLTTTQDYPRMLNTLRQRERREGIAVKLVTIPVPARTRQELVDAFTAGMTPRTRIVLVCHQVNLTGQIMPVKEICDAARARGIETVVDGAHAFAQFAFTQKELGCDYYGASLHKWLYAPKGTGMLFVRKEKIGKVWPLMAADRKQADDIRKFEEIGTHSIAPKLAIGEALAFHAGIGAKRKEERLRYLTRYWMERLKEEPRVYFNTSFDDAFSCAIGNFGVEGMDPAALGSHLFAKHRILTTPIIHDEFKGIRITPNLYTTLPELDRFCSAVLTAVRTGIPSR